MYNIYKEAFSWKLISVEYAEKKVDKSFYAYGETVIPIELRKYFEIDRLSYSDKLDIVLIFKGKEYNCTINFENNFNRSKLKLNKDLKIKVSKIIDLVCPNRDFEKSGIKIIFIKKNSNNFFMILRIEI